MFKSGALGLRQSIVSSAAAWSLFAVGLIAPLTPSEGHPGLTTVGVFVGAPIVTLGVVALTAANRAYRPLAWLQLAAVACIAWRVLWVVFGTSSPPAPSFM